ncbi:hypothetical protein HY251_06410 [bacterium]|nr:hypothetical protein [bacterium]
MPDHDLRTLERMARATPNDLVAWMRYVRALELAGRDPPPDLAEHERRLVAQARESTIRVGDEVWVEENDGAWLVGRWRGIVTACRIEEDDGTGRQYVRFRVRPKDLVDDDTNPLPWRVRPLPEQRVRGLELSRHDRLELIARGVDRGPFPK